MSGGAPSAKGGQGHGRVLRIAGPIVLSNVTVPLLGLVDTGVVGQLGQAAPIGAVGIGAVILTAFYWVFGFLRMGTTGLAAQAHGRGDGPETVALLSRALLIAGAAGLALMALSPLLFAGAFLIAPASEEVESLARDYMAIRIFSAPAAIAVYGVTGWLIALERTRAVLAMQVWMNGLNIVLDLAFVLGLGWGVEGVALATFLAEWAGLAAGLWFCRDAFAAAAPPASAGRAVVAPNPADGGPAKPGGWADQGAGPGNGSDSGGYRNPAPGSDAGAGRNAEAAAAPGQEVPRPAIPGPATGAMPAAGPQAGLRPGAARQSSAAPAAVPLPPAAPPPWRDWRRISDRARLLQMAAVNGDILIRTLLLEAIFVSFLFMAADLGDVTLAANQVLLQFLHVTAYALDGFAFAAETLVGQAVGGRRPAALDRFVRLTSLWGAGSALVLAAGFGLLGPWVIALMTTSEAVRDAAGGDLVYMVLVPILGVAAWMLDGIFIGATRSRDMRNMMVVSAAIYALAAAVLVPPFGNEGLWLALLISLVARGVTLGARYPALRRSVG